MSNREKAGRGVPVMPPNKKVYSKSQERMYALVVVVVIAAIVMLEC